MTLIEGGHSSVGRVQASQAWGRGFKPRRPLQPFLRFVPAHVDIGSAEMDV